jgi:hypothetical protein
VPAGWRNSRAAAAGTAAEQRAARLHCAYCLLQPCSPPTCICPASYPNASLLRCIVRACRVA